MGAIGATASKENPMLYYIALLQNFLTQPLRKDREQGATAVEYGLMVALIAVFIIGAVTLVGTGLDALFNDVADELPAPVAP
jgi:pilus assembly protein Flp/PilA